MFPHESSSKEDGGVEEERRLMYVAITRARKRLYLSFAQSRVLHGQVRYHVRSRFFEELPEASLKWLTPVAAPNFGGQRREKGERGESGWGRDWFKKPEDVPYTGSQPTGGMDKGQGYADAKRQAGSGFRIGQQVFHNKFGEGKITGLEGDGADARANINFKRHGAKWLALAVAKLDPID
jgi:DNA helicase-2/ATP-dependent DNA helicase PcrA